MKGSKFRGVLMSIVIIALMCAGTAQAQTPPLKFFKNYFLTGDHLARGVSLWRKGGLDGKASVNISVSGVPSGADVVAAFLYIQTAERVQWSGINHVKFRGNDLGPGGSSLAKALNWNDATAPCWSVNFPGGRRLVTYRADVLPYFPLDTTGTADTNPSFGKLKVNGLHRLIVPDFGIQFGDDDEGGIERVNHLGPRAIGASLVIIYRDPTKPFRSIVIYDGGSTKRALATMTQPLQGFYQSSTLADPIASLSMVVGDGRPFLSEKVLLSKTSSSNPFASFTNPFISADGAKWDTPTFNLTGKFPRNASTAIVKVEPHLVPDCVSFSAMILDTTVQDSDNDGLLDAWESASTSGTLVDPKGQRLPDLHAMGAHWDRRDLFVEVGAMTATPGTTYGPPDERPVCRARLRDGSERTQS